MRHEAACLGGAAGRIVAGEALAVAEHVPAVPEVLDTHQPCNIGTPVQAPPISSLI